LDISNVHARKVDCRSLSLLSTIYRSSMDLNAARANSPAPRKQLQLISLDYFPGDKSARDHGSKALHRKRAIDRQAGYIVRRT
jgi:hypothetical protein